VKVYAQSDKEFANPLYRALAVPSPSGGIAYRGVKRIKPLATATVATVAAPTTVAATAEE
jgi:hypothetical protein